MLLIGVVKMVESYLIYESKYRSLIIGVLIEFIIGVLCELLLKEKLKCIFL